MGALNQSTASCGKDDQGDADACRCNHVKNNTTLLPEPLVKRARERFTQAFT